MGDTIGLKVSFLGIVFNQLFFETELQVLQGQLVLTDLEFHLNRLTNVLQLFPSAFRKELMLQDLVNSGPRPWVKGHGYVQDIDDLLRHLREHLIETFLLAALKTPKVVLRVLVGKELHFLGCRLAQGGQDHR